MDNENSPMNVGDIDGRLAWWFGSASISGIVTFERVGFMLESGLTPERAVVPVVTSLIWVLTMALAVRRARYLERVNPTE